MRECLWPSWIICGVCLRNELTVTMGNLPVNRAAATPLIMSRGVVFGRRLAPRRPHPTRPALCFCVRPVPAQIADQQGRGKTPVGKLSQNQN